jgi:microcystin-dependent protein
MSVLLSPIGNGFQFLTTTGLPLNGGYIYTYQAGSTTPLTTYSDVNGLIPNANPIVLGTDGRPQTEIWLTQGFSYKFVLTDSSNNQIQTYDNLYGILQTAPAASGTVPSGLIAIWSSSIGSIPSGWTLCNGQNGTPDLRNSFILGAGNSYAVGATGGSTDAIVPSHTHTASSSSSASSSATVTDPGHFHNANNSAPGSPSQEAFLRGTSAQYVPVADPYLIQSNTTGITVGVSTSVSTSTTVATTGTSVTNANMPPYYALAFIMKI